MPDKTKQIQVIKGGLAYWLKHGRDYLVENNGSQFFGWISSDIGEYHNINDVPELAGKFKDCLASMALAFKQVKNHTGLKKFNDVMDTALQNGYENAYGNIRGTGLDGFLKYVLERDQMLGYDAGGRKIDHNEFEYWINDPFASLKDLTDREYETISVNGYVATKMRFFFDPDATNWKISLEESPRSGDAISLFRMRRKGQSTDAPEEDHKRLPVLVA